MENFDLVLNINIRPIRIIEKIDFADEYDITVTDEETKQIFREVRALNEKVYAKFTAEEVENFKIYKIVKYVNELIMDAHHTSQVKKREKNGK